MAATFKLGEMPESLRSQVIEILAAAERAKIVAASARLRAAGRQGGECKRLDDGTSGGEKTMSIDASSYHHWGQRLGYECWDNKQFCREYLRDNEYARVKSVAKNLTVGWVGNGVRERKSYGNN